MVDVHTGVMAEPLTSSVPRPVHHGAPKSGIRVPRSVGFVATSASLIAFFLAAGAPTPLLPLYEHQWGFAPSVLTLIFGVYALAMVVSLLFIGSLSDYIGRRPILIGALALELISMVIFLFAPSVGWLIIGRVLQGIATGVASSTFGAAAVELASERRKKVGALMTSLASTAGLGVGALFAGIIALAVPASAATAVWIILAVVMVLGTILAIFTPETSTRRPGAAGSLVPKFEIPSNVRRLFAATAPSIAATFVLSALFLGLIPTILAGVFGIQTAIIGGLLTFAMFGAAAVASVTTSGIHPHQLKIYGNIGIIIGSILIMAAVGTTAVSLLWIGGIIAGVGMGATFSGSARGLVPEVKPHQRAGLFAGIFFVAYISLGVSAIVAGYVAGAIGVASMAVGFAGVLAIISLIALLLSAGIFARSRREQHAAAGAR
jgi:MFS family permease